MRGADVLRRGCGRAPTLRATQPRRPRAAGAPAPRPRPRAPRLPRPPAPAPTPTPAPPRPQAYRHKYLGGRNAATFAPETLRREGAAAGLALRESRHAAVEGLGRFVLSNIRTPKRLMDVGGGGGAPDQGGRKGGDEGGGGGGGGAPAAPAARLEEEPMLAARVLIEDCYANLLKVEDLDRAAAADEAAGVALDASSPAGAALARERGALLRGVVTSLQLAASPDGGGGGGPGDWVFLRVMALPKGRLMLAKALRFMCHPATGRPAGGGGGGARGGGRDGGTPGPRRRQQRPWNEGAGDGAGAAAAPAATASVGGALGAEGVAAPAVWAVLRNARELFGPAVVPGAGAARAEGEKRMTAATEALASAAAESLRRVPAAGDAAAAAAALVAGLDSSAYPLLPLFPAGRAAAGAQPAWLGSAVSALLLRATELGLGAEARPGADLRDGSPEDGAPPAEADAPPDAAAAAAWRAAYGKLQAAVARHLEALQAAKSGDGAAAAAAALPADAAAALRAHAAELACVPLVRAMVSDHAAGHEREALRSLLLEVSR
jgi:hypothetical protein